MEFTRLDHDQASDTEFEEVAAFMTAMNAVDRPWHSSRTPAALAAFLRERQSGFYDVSLWLAREGADAGARAGRLTAVGWLNLASTAENRHFALVELRVDPERRRRGIGTDFFRTLIPELRAAGRSRVIGSGDSRGSAEFWGATVGLVPTLRSLKQVLRFADADRSAWDCPPVPGFRFETWTDRAPEHLLDSYATARQAMEDSVSEDLGWNHPRWTPERVRDAEARLAGGGHGTRVVVAIEEAGGEIAGLTEILFPAFDPLCPEQNDTAVRREHRGRGLGLAMKAAQLRALAERPELVQVTTGTGDLVHMAGINRALGYRDVAETVYMEADLDDIAAVLG